MTPVRNTRLLSLGILGMLGIAAGALSAQGAVLESGSLRVELIGLKRWTLPMIQDSLSRYAPNDSLLSHSCAAILRGKLHFADASAEYVETDGKTQVTVTIVEPQDSALIHYLAPYRDSLPDRQSWTPIREAFEKHNHPFQAAIQSRAFLLTDEALVSLDTVANVVRSMRRLIREQRSPAARRTAIVTLERDGNMKNRIAAIVVLSQFAASDSTWWALVDALRDPDGPVSATATQVLSLLSTAAQRPVDWTPAMPALRALLDGTNLFAHNQVMETLAATHVSPNFAPTLLRGGGAIVLAKLSAMDPHARRAAHNLLTQLAGRDLGDDPATWRIWVAAL